MNLITPPIRTPSPGSLVNIELETSRASTPTSATVAITPHSPEALAELKTQMTDLFRGDRTENNGEEMDALVQGRANRLHELGYVPADVERLLDKAERMDRVTVPTQGAVGGLPFGVVTVVLDKVPGVTADAAGNPGYTGYIAGAMSGAADVVGGGVLGKTTEDSLWLKRRPTSLKRLWRTRRRPSPRPIRSSRQGKAPWPSRHSAPETPFVWVLAILNASNLPKVAAAVDTAIGSVGGMVAGAGYAVLMHNNQKAAGLVGGAQLFGRKDWEDQFEELKKCSPSQPYINGAKRAAKFPLDVATETLSAVRKVFEGGNLLTNGGALAGGFALTGMARNAAKQAALNQGLPKGAVAAADHAVNVVGSAITFAAYGAAGVLAGKAVDKGVEVIQEEVPRKALDLAVDKAKATGALVGSARDGLITAGNAISGVGTAAMRVLRQRPAPTVDGADQV